MLFGSKSEPAMWATRTPTRRRAGDRVGGSPERQAVAELAMGPLVGALELSGSRGRSPRGASTLRVDVR